MLRTTQRRARWSVLGSDPTQAPPKSHTTERVALRQNMNYPEQNRDKQP